MSKGSDGDFEFDRKTGRVEQEVNYERPREYIFAYEAAAKMKAQGRTADDIRRELHRPPSFDPLNRSPRHEYEVADGLAKVRREAIDTLLAGLPMPRHYRSAVDRWD